MAPTVFIGRELEVPGDELPALPAGQVNTAEELGLFLNLSDSESHSSPSIPAESRETSPLLAPSSSAEPAIAASEMSDLGEPVKPMESAPVRKITKKPKVTKEVKPVAKTTQRRHRRKQMEIYGTTAPRRSSRVPTEAPVQISKAPRKKKDDVPKKRGRKSKQTAAKANQNSASGEQWEVESIVDSQIDADTLEHFYKVKWKGYSSKENTWEPKSNLLDCRDALLKYERQKKK